jgi:hypothetical protein
MIPPLLPLPAGPTSQLGTRALSGLFQRMLERSCLLGHCTAAYTLAAALALIHASVNPQALLDEFRNLFLPLEAWLTLNGLPLLFAYRRSRWLLPLLVALLVSVLGLYLVGLPFGGIRE